MLLRRQSIAKCNKPPRPRPPLPSSLWRGATSPTSSSRTSFFCHWLRSLILSISPQLAWLLSFHTKKSSSAPPQSLGSFHNRFIAVKSPRVCFKYISQDVSRVQGRLASLTIWDRSHYLASTSEDSPYSLLEQIFTKIPEGSEIENLETSKLVMMS